LPNAPNFFRFQTPKPVLPDQTHYTNFHLPSATGTLACLPLHSLEKLEALCVKQQEMDLSSRRITLKFSILADSIFIRSILAHCINRRT
jgi:hypothetical protein